MTQRYLVKEITKTENRTIRFYDFHYGPHQKFPLHVDKKPRISIVLNGKVKERAGRTEIFGEASSVVIKPGEVLHDNEFGPQGARLFSVVVHPQLARLFEDHEFFKEWRWYHANQMANFVTKYLQRLKISEDLVSETIDFVASLSNQETSEEGSPPSWLNHIIEQIHDEPQKNYSVQDLAQSAGVHPVYMARVFQKHLKCGVKEYIHQTRLKMIISALSDGKSPLVEVALETGYADQSHMSRFFKNATGISPGAFRRLIQTF